jgi:hypothetical protein
MTVSFPASGDRKASSVRVSSGVLQKGHRALNILPQKAIFQVNCSGSVLFMLRCKIEKQS